MGLITGKPTPPQPPPPRPPPSVVNAPTYPQIPKVPAIQATNTSRPCVQIGGIKVSVVKGQIVEEKVDVIVNGVPPDLDLGKPKGSAILVKAAGPSIQAECNSNYPNGIKVGEIAETGSGNLKCKQVYHVTLPMSQSDGSENKEVIRTVKKCLKRANYKKHTSIAFPDIGTSVGFPANILADLMFQGVTSFTKELPNSCISSVVFSIYKGKVYQEFVNKAREIAAVSRVSHCQHGNVNIHLKIGKLSDQQVDVIVCSGPKDLQLDNGGLAGALLAVAGPQLQQECDTKYPNGINYGDLAITQGHNLKCKFVYFGSLPDWGTPNPDPKQTLEKFVTKCLEEANKHPLTKTIAFPTLGTGSLKFPSDTVAKSMAKCVGDFDKAHPNTQLQHISIVVYIGSGNWMSVEQAFLNELSMSKGSNPVSVPATMPPGGPVVQGTHGSLQYYKALYNQVPITPSYWTKFNNSKTLTDWNTVATQTPYVLITVDPATFRAVEELAVKSWKSQFVGCGRDAVGLDKLKYKSIKVTKVERVENPILFERYVKHRADLFKKAGKTGSFKSLDQVPVVANGAILTTSLASGVLKTDIYPGINEHYLFHGTLEIYLNNILTQGLDPRLTISSAFFGKGVYSAESSTKSDQYTDDPNHRDLKEKKMFLIRMCLGDMYIRTDTTTQRHYRKPPCKTCYEDWCTDQNHGHFFDSIIVDGGWNFREFIVYDKEATYPEYLITYKRV